MPIDPRIPLGVQPPQPIDVTRGMVQGATLARMQAVTERERAISEQERAEAAERTRLQGVRDQFTGVLRKYNGDVEKASAELMAIDPKAASDLQRDYFNIKKTQLDIDTARLERLDDLGMRVTDQHSYDMYKAGAKAVGLPIDGMPAEYTPEYMADLNSRTKQGIERAKAMRERFQHVNIDVDGKATVGAFDPATGKVTSTGVPAATRAATGGGSDYSDFLTTFAKERGKTPDQLTVAENVAARKAFGQADDRPRLAPQPIVIQTAAGPQLLDKGSGTTRAITDASGQVLTPAPTAEMRNRQFATDKALKGIAAVKALSEKIITKVGPAQRADALKRGAAAVFGSDPNFRAYQDARFALAGNLAVMQQGSRPSDADIKLGWLPLVPDVYSDTKESAAVKWDLINTMSGGQLQEPAAPKTEKANPFRKK